MEEDLNQYDEDEIGGSFILKGKKYRKVNNMDKPYIGITLVIDHGKKLLKKLKLDTDKKYVSTISVLLNKDWKNDEGNRKKVVGIVHFTIDQGTDGYPILDSSKIKINFPIDLISNDEYFFDVRTKKFYEGTRNITLKSIVDQLFEQHLKPTKPIRGFYLRWKIRNAKFLSLTTLNFAKLIAKIYYLIFGEKVAHDFFSEFKLKRLTPFDEEKEDPFKKVKVLDIFGYQASAHLVFFFCISHLFLYSILIYWKIAISMSIRNIVNSNFLVVMYSITVLYILEEYCSPLFKMTLLKSLKHARKLHEYISAKNITI